ncbi:MAG: TetR family transcriptional regulator [Micrococcaceae bacterium]|nr:TetR family transcriptional regulator [Micrococcaceae bacterium]
MPKIVDPDVRRLTVVDAVMRVVSAAGLEQASLRTVAEEADLALGSVRHYFDGQNELMVFTFATATDRMRTRLEERMATALDRDPGAAGDVAALVEVLAALLPEDQERRREASVRLAFLAAARTNASYRAEAERNHRSIAVVIGRIILAILDHPGAPAGADPVMEAERLLALTDGLALHMLLHPDWTSSETARGVLAVHLASLAGR